MNQQPDKIFRDKLQSFQRPAPAGAWGRIEKNLDKKNDKAFWLKIAATLLMVAIATYLLWPANSTKTPVTPIAKSDVKQDVKRDSTKSNQAIDEDTAVLHEPIAQKSKPLVNAKKRKRVDAEQKTHSPGVDTQNRDIAVVANDKPKGLDASNEALNTDKSEMITTSESVAEVTAQPQRVKIIFSAEEIDNKYLDKNAVAQATSDSKKPSTLKKIFDKAYDLKYNQDPFGDLRDKKNEILALNFRTDKQRSDKK